MRPEEIDEEDSATGDFILRPLAGTSDELLIATEMQVLPDDEAKKSNQTVAELIAVYIGGCLREDVRFRRGSEYRWRERACSELSRSIPTDAPASMERVARLRNRSLEA